MRQTPIRNRSDSPAEESTPVYPSAADQAQEDGTPAPAGAPEDSLEPVTSLAEALCYVVDETLRDDGPLSPVRNEHFQDMADASPVCLWTSNPAGDVTFVSQWWYDFTGQAPREALVQGWLSAVHPEDRKRIAEIARGAKERREVFSAEYKLRRHDGEYHWVLGLSRPRLDANGNIVEFIGSIVDVQEAKQNAEWLEIHTAELTHVGRLIEMGQMVAALSHELSQPLNAISNYAGICEMYLQRTQAELTDMREAVHQLVRQVDRARETLRRVREFARKKEPQRVACDLQSVVDDSLQLMENELRRNSIQVVREQPDEDINLMADRVQIQQVLVNLISNARDAMLNLPSEERVLSIRLRREEERAFVEVEDRGPGVSPEVVERLFEPFVTTKESGIGLGLNICLAIVQAHGGKISALPADGRGTRMRVELPLLQA
jgi:PAS domain S-box-containing protein